MSGSSALDIGTTGMILVYVMGLIPLILLAAAGIGMTLEIVKSALKMSLQLLLVGIYLKYIFELQNPWVNLLWIGVMILVANTSILKQAGLKVTTLFPRTMAGLLLGTSVAALFMIGLIVRPTPLYDAHYLIPITGMILGNCLRGNILSLERFYTGIREGKREYMDSLLMGASRWEAAAPFARKAIRTALAPILSTMATTGVVSLPGMMTGQILGGSFPLVAIKYQIAIMIAIFTAMSLSAVANIIFSMGRGFDDYDLLREDIFA
ncbi:MAG: ABC transporter permease [Candidatus Wallbacteria bacterium HGW-Wallbacteria-1]|jgi:putative ABC transport system permease protein|uniref:ABC transporter permease n=1 Tax=Candidatus Wallbacteria bacterium HGW-Wallbacteria-1 TaxID=2013854 RepID=A0A2N1PP30_9BACT|nr:MAG: ABC transporter permease [Candidatus Wallbacteria bacterium HGW-Wallbacteria-1]